MWLHDLVWQKWMRNSCGTVKFCNKKKCNLLLVLNPESSANIHQEPTTSCRGVCHYRFGHKARHVHSNASQWPLRGSSGSKLLNIIQKFSLNVIPERKSKSVGPTNNHEIITNRRSVRQEQLMWGALKGGVAESVFGILTWRTSSSG